MNTDNLSIIGITIDLNVFGFLGEFDRSWAPNHIDNEGRYAYVNQASIAKWNLQRLADAMTGTEYIEDHEPDSRSWFLQPRGEWLSTDAAQRQLSRFDDRYNRCFVARHRIKLGLPLASSAAPPASLSYMQADALVDRWLDWLESARADYHLAHRALAEAQGVEDGSSLEADVDSLMSACSAIETEGLRSDLRRWLEDYFARLSHADRHDARAWRVAMRAANPVIFSCYGPYIVMALK